MKKVLVTIIIIVILAAAWYLLSPLWSSVELDEASPLQTAPVVKDSFETMDIETRAEFEAQMEISKDVVMTMEEAMPDVARLIAQAQFQPRAHSVEGRALLIEEAGEKIVRFEDFETINGPNLHIYLSSELGDGDFVDLGKIRATKGSVNYEVPTGTDTTRYNKVLVWCVPFGVLFSYASFEAP